MSQPSIVALPDQPPEPVEPRPVVANLPCQPTPLIGRRREVEAACELLRRPEVRLLTLTQGTLTFYSADDPTCTGHPVAAGSAFLDPGDHTHNARNETNSPVENYVVRMLPAGGASRIDVPDPGVCPW